MWGYQHIYIYTHPCGGTMSPVTLGGRRMSPRKSPSHWKFPAGPRMQSAWGSGPGVGGFDVASSREDDSLNRDQWGSLGINRDQ